MAEIYEWHARHSPQHPVFQYLDDDKNLKTITFLDALQAIYRGGWLLRTAMKKTSRTQEKRSVIAIVALSGTNLVDRHWTCVLKVEMTIRDNIVFYCLPRLSTS